MSKATRQPSPSKRRVDGDLDCFVTTMSRRRRISMTVSTPYSVASVNLSPEAARRLAQRLIGQADGIDARATRRAKEAGRC